MGKTIDKILSFVERQLPGILLLLSVIVLFINVVLRYLFHAATTWAEEAIRYAIIWITFVGSSLCARKSSHVGIDIFVDMLSGKRKKIALALAQFISALFTALCTLFSWQIFLMVLRTGQRSPAMLMPMAIVYFAMPLGFFLTTTRFVQVGVRILKTPVEKLGGKPQSANDIDLSQLN
ncbi:C4-dicarboxylate ABC transporter permease [Synergistales bacterium]|nr:C4-dicarboxylate ABC transporter permease [Synergistales bacterium]